MWSELVLCILATSVLGQNPVPYYIVLVPAEVHYPSTETACIHVCGAREKLMVTLTLQSVGRDTTLFQQHMEGSSLFKCVSFQVLPPTIDKEEVVTIHISLVGPSTMISEGKNILIRDMGSHSVIQTDKPIYKPDQTVNFRILSFDRDFLAVNDAFPLVELQDPNKNRIGQWLDVSPQQGIISLSFPLDSEAPLGLYTIKSPNAEQTFRVAEYVMPKFAVTVSMPPVVTLVDEHFKMKVCGLYSFGQPVQGEVKAQICRRVAQYFWFPQKRPQDLCRTYTGRTDSTGCLTPEISTSFYQMRAYDYQLRFEAEASLVEDDTGVQLNGSSSCRISALIAKVTYDDAEISDTHYKPGLRYKGLLKLVSADGSPMKSERLYLTENYNRVTTEHVYETDENGLVCFTLDTKKWDRHTVILRASYQREGNSYSYGELSPYYQEAHITLQPFTTIANSFLKVQPMDLPLSCDQEHRIEIDYIIRGSELMSDQETVEAHYVVMGKGNLVLNGKLDLKVNHNSVVMGTVELPLLVTAHLAPLAHILVYVVLGDGRIAADTEKFPINKCFNNKVNLDFSNTESSPGSNISLVARASPGSLCAMRVVDESVLLLRPEAELSSDSLYRLLAQRIRYGYDYRVQERDPACWVQHSHFSKRSLTALQRRKRYAYWPTTTSIDVFTLIMQMGVKILTNTKVKNPKECHHYPYIAAMSSFGSFFDSDIQYEYQAPLVQESSHETDYEREVLAEVTNRKRTLFPETWLWISFLVGTSGAAVMSYTIPDSITTWRADLFCMADVGLGVSPTASFKAFMPLFVDLTLPSSVLRGEAAVVTASVYNYLSTDMAVKVTLKETPEMQIAKCPLCDYTQCVPAQKTRVYTWKMTLHQLGDAQIEVNVQQMQPSAECGGESTMEEVEEAVSDTVVRTLQVKPEGIPVEMFQNSLLCDQGNLSSETISLSAPLEAVPGSVMAQMSINGDMMGATLQGIHLLLDLPRACGEQNMVRFAPNIYLMNYLEKTNQMTEAIKTNGIEYILQGYQRQLLFLREDFSFSTFGKKDKEGNTWLTAFVLKCFSAASSYTPVDELHLRQAGLWLKENQLPSGGFRSRGKLFNANLKGGIKDEVALSAYVLIALLESKWPIEDDMVQCSMQFLRSAVAQEDYMYTKALLAYVFALSKDYELRDALLKDLYEKAVKKDGHIYWPSTPKRLSKASKWSQPDSFEVELAAYVILAYLSVNNPTKEDINSASSIVSWIILQRNPHGGFASTQDTVVALQALSLFCALTYTGFAGLEVIVSRAGAEDPQHRLWVDSSTRFLLHKIPLKTLPANYSVQVKGEGCVYLQTLMRYNTYTVRSSPAFDLRLSTSRMGFEDLSASSFSLIITVRLTLPLQVTNMVLIEANMLSGHSIVPDSLKKLNSHSLVKKIEINQEKLVIYVSELHHQTESFSFLLQQDIPVANLEPQLVKVYDYYAPGNIAHAMYNRPPNEVEQVTHTGGASGQ